MKTKILLISLCAVSYTVSAQETPLCNYRPNDQQGLNIFETTKSDSFEFTGVRLRIGGNFTQDFQNLSHKNSATPVLNTSGANVNQLVGLTSGFNRAMANLRFDALLAPGVRLNLELYLSSRHHEETWVKGGYIQLDELPFLHSYFFDNLMKSVTLKIGDMEVDYGDAHFRRTDGGNTFFNPFVENYIMDEFATEVGGEIYYHSRGGALAMFGVTNGELNPTAVAPIKIDSATGKTNKYPPAFIAKIGFDKKFASDLRFRLTGSLYAVKSAASNSLFFGDRTGSHYWLVMENSSDAVNNAWSGRFNPLFSEQVTTFMINPFIKVMGLEFFGTYEMAQGRTITEKSKRKDTQLAGDLIYRFPMDKENFWVGVRYNTLKAALPGISNDVKINRVVGSIGWYATKNLLLKGEYVDQNYKDFPSADIRSGGKFNGWMLEAAVAF
jgi:hypothetical protein